MTKKDVNFRFEKFDEDRALQGQPAAQIFVEQLTAKGFHLWMNPKHIQKNIAWCGDHPELQKALQAYQNYGDKNVRNFQR